MWTELTAQDVQDQFTAAERAVIEVVQGDAGDKLAGIVAKVVAQVRDDIRSGGYALDADETTIPAGLHNDAIAIARWKLLVTLPADEDIQSKERKAEQADALAKLRRISESKYSVEPPTGAPGGEGGVTANRAGNWNSNNKIVGRAHPVPRPAGQSPADPNSYANPDAPADQS
jgi:hypothetical protein